MSSTLGQPIDTPLECPSCGAGIQVNYRFAKMVVCDYCGQTNYLNPDETLEGKGPKQLPLVDYGSKLSKTAYGKIEGREFRVLGRMRYEYPEGFWDEWLLKMADDPETPHWLQEDEGEFSLLRFEKDQKVTQSYEQFKVGETYEVGDGLEVFITEANSAKVTGSEGQIPFYIEPNEQVYFVDGIKKGFRLSMEFIPGDETELYMGQPVSIHDIEITGK